ncbi:putative aldo/keto reductase family protein [Legionella lansingensis]|uniref:Putative aldo/keto reductase family protein n=1 Tax=Legionella lansingensis TaxID=45067 RepID=A0A0W0VWB3_9GAMM|nr:aldo/keto reductase [Legionella lansingensis]KTD24306.1 putative aldo/keto reductase family protein [Legionella lansingensis]SNV51844.1 putative aldo/keto reductase family protein [Legionella lansingensis]
MTPSNVQLALGTVQFGVKYGIAGRGEPVPPKEVRQIFARAWELGIRALDTAPVYGDIEERLDALVGDYPFKMVSKIPAIPHELSANAMADFVIESIDKTRQRLGRRLDTLLFHCSDDLLHEQGEFVWNTASKAISDSTIRLGVSCYSPLELEILHGKYPVEVAQVPGNAFDQRLMSATHLNGVELYLRSVFLQGILLLAPEIVAKRLPQATGIINAWQNWCNHHGLSPLQAALSIAKGLPGVRYCVVGVDRLSHLEEIMSAWDSITPMSDLALATTDQDIIDPRCWHSKETRYEVSK